MHTDLSFVTHSANPNWPVICNLHCLLGKSANVAASSLEGPLLCCCGLQVLDISKAKVYGLEGLTYLDKVPICPSSSLILESALGKPYATACMHPDCCHFFQSFPHVRPWLGRAYACALPQPAGSHFPLCYKPHCDRL